MMKITLKSKVSEQFTSVFKRFDQELFSYLLPPGARLLAYGGSEKGDIVHLKLPVVGDWVSEIIENSKSPDSFYFIDEGRKLPFPLKRWKHKHVLLRKGSGTIIEDHMSFSTGTIITDILVYPFLLLAFLPRVWQYKSYFNKG